MIQPDVFRTSHKPLSYYCDTPETQSLMAEFGSHLQQLTQEEKYQVISAIGLFLWRLSADQEAPAEDDDFGIEEEEPMIDVNFDNNCFNLTLNDATYKAVRMLYHSEPEALAAMLPAIAFYAAEDSSR